MLEPRKAQCLRVSFCGNPKCGCVHFDLYDGEGRAFAAAVVQPDAAREIMREMTQALYALAVLKDDP